MSPLPILRIKWSSRSGVTIADFGALCTGLGRSAAATLLRRVLPLDRVELLTTPLTTTSASSSARRHPSTTL